MEFVKEGDIFPLCLCQRRVAARLPRTTLPRVAIFWVCLERPLPLVVSAYVALSLDCLLEEKCFT